MALFRSVRELIGNTPLLQLTRFKLPEGVRLYAKLEFMNPGGSVKDRLGAMLIDRALERGLLKPGGTIVEPTAGNTGIGLAIAAVGYDMKTIFVVPEKFSIEKRRLMEALGANIVNTPSADGMAGAIRKAEELAARLPGAYMPAQFANEDNPETYYRTLAPEIWRDMNGAVDIFVAGAGSGGTFMGTARYLKERNPRVKTVVVEPQGSTLAGGAPGSHRTEGIGVESPAPFMDRSFFDAIHTVSDDNAFARVKELAIYEGLLAGSSSGAALHAALNEAASAKAGSRIVTVFPDGSERYLSQNIYEGGE